MRPSSAGTITNEAQVTSGVGDPDPSNNSASAETTVDPAADLSLTNTDAPDPVHAGQQLTYTLTGAERRALRRHRASPSPTPFRRA